MNFIINYSSLILLFFGTMIGFGLVNSLIRKASSTYIYWTSGSFGLWLTSFIGTSVHECAHAFFVIMSGHKINGMKLFPSIKQFGSGEPLGYVNYSHSRGFFGMMSLFFIGIGPMLWGPILILVLMKLLLPSTYSIVLDTINTFFATPDSINIVSMLGNIIVSFFKGIFSIEIITSWQFFVFLFLACSIACHTTLSWADIKGALKGFLYLLLIIIGFGACMIFFVDLQTKILQLISIFTIFFIVLYIMSFLFSLLIFVFNYFLYEIIKKMR